MRSLTAIPSSMLGATTLLAALLSLGCSGDETNEPERARGGTGGGAGAPAGGGATSTGGSATGGAQSGGSSNGGTEAGGAPPGGASGNASSGAGASAGGNSPGGTSAGGNSGGGAANGGTGAATGGSAGTSSSGGSGGTGSGRPSAGCDGSASPASGRFTLDVSGTEREYVLKVPNGYDPNRPYPLILAWHGRQYSAEWVANGDPPQTGPYFGIEAAANGGAILVAPQALESGFTNQGDRDLAFTDAMVERFRAELCVNEDRIFSTGFSMGGMMTIAIGCARGDVFRAIAPMSASLQTGCADGSEPVAYWSSHGDTDNTVTVATGQLARDEFASRNGCDTATAPTSRDGCVSNEGCDAGYPVTFCIFSGAHVPAPYAGEAIWEFFSELP